MTESAQPAPETDEKKSRGLGSYVVWAFLAVMVYVLSSGPAMKAASPKSERVLEVLYAPLNYLYTKPPLRKPLGMYWHLWRPDLFLPNGHTTYET